MDVLLVTIAVFLAPALALGGIASAVARWRATRQGEGLEQVGRRIKRAFWLTFLITVGIELLAFGLCIAALQDSFG